MEFPYDEPNVRAIPSSDIYNVGCGTTNSRNGASAINPAAHIASRRPGWKHYANDARGTSANADHSSAESNHNATELDDDATNYNDRAANADYNQGGRAWYPACSAAQ